MQQHLRVTCSGKGITQLKEILSQSPKVEDLPIEHDDDAAGVITHWLRTRR